MISDTLFRGLEKCAARSLHYQTDDLTKVEAMAVCLALGVDPCLVKQAVISDVPGYAYQALPPESRQAYADRILSSASGPGSPKTPGFFNAENFGTPGVATLGGASALGALGLVLGARKGFRGGKALWRALYRGKSLAKQKTEDIAARAARGTAGMTDMEKRRALGEVGKQMGVRQGLFGRPVGEWGGKEWGLAGGMGLGGLLGIRQLKDVLGGGNDAKVVRYG